MTVGLERAITTRAKQMSRPFSVRQRQNVPLPTTTTAAAKETKTEKKFQRERCDHCTGTSRLLLAVAAICRSLFRVFASRALAHNYAFHDKNKERNYQQPTTMNVTSVFQDELCRLVCGVATITKKTKQLFLFCNAKQTFRAIYEDWVSVWYRRRPHQPSRSKGSKSVGSKQVKICGQCLCR